MRVGGILETALYVENLARAAEFYRTVFGFETLLESEKLIALNVAEKNVLLLFLNGSTTEPATLPGGVIPAHGCKGSTHFAFSIEGNEVEAWRSHLVANGVPVESTVDWPGGARSLYFRDLDRHLGELISQGFWKTY